MKELLRLNLELKEGIKGCGPPDFTGLFACLAAVLVCIVMVFPGLYVLRNSITAFSRKLQQTQQASNLRKAQRETYVRSAPILGNRTEKDTAPILTSMVSNEDLNSGHWPNSSLQRRAKSFVRRGSVRADHPYQPTRHSKFNEGYLVGDLASSIPESFT